MKGKNERDREITHIRALLQHVSRYVINKLCFLNKTHTTRVDDDIRASY